MRTSTVAPDPPYCRMRQHSQCRYTCLEEAYIYTGCRPYLEAPRLRRGGPDAPLSNLQVGRGWVSNSQKRENSLVKMQVLSWDLEPRTTARVARISNTPSQDAYDIERSMLKLPQAVQHHHMRIPGKSTSPWHLWQDTRAWPASSGGNASREAELENSRALEACPVGDRISTEGEAKSNRQASSSCSDGVETG